MVSAPGEAARNGIQLLSSVLSIARDVVVLAAIYLYFAGYMYKYYFFDSFHIKSALDSVSPYVAFVYSYTVFWGNRWAVAIDLAVCLLVFLIIARLVRDPHGRRLAISVCAVIIALGAFPVLNKWSGQAASADARGARALAAKGNDTALTITTGAKNYYGDDFLAAATGEGLHILAKTDSNTYFLQQPPDGSTAFPKVTVVPNSQIGSIYVDQNQ